MSVHIFLLTLVLLILTSQQASATPEVSTDQAAEDENLPAPEVTIYWESSQDDNLFDKLIAAQEEPGGLSVDNILQLDQIRVRTVRSLRSAQS